AAAVVVGVDHPGLERQHRAGSLLHGHGVGQVHGHESDVDVPQRPHFRDVLGIACDIQLQRPQGKHIAVVTALVVVLQPLGSQVVGGNGGDRDPATVLRSPLRMTWTRSASAGGSAARTEGGATMGACLSSPSAARVSAFMWSGCRWVIRIRSGGGSSWY